MKTCTWFHEENVEIGDRLLVSPNEDVPETEIVVKDIYRTGNFGWVIKPVSGEEIYLADGWTVRAADGDMVRAQFGTEAGWAAAGKRDGETEVRDRLRAQMMVLPELDHEARAAVLSVIDGDAG